MCVCNVCCLFQVIRGGNFDVDLRLFSPSGKIMYDEQRKQYDSISFYVEETGEHYFCFSNEFSSFTHKTVYFDLISDLGEPFVSMDVCVRDVTVCVHEFVHVCLSFFLCMCVCVCVRVCVCVCACFVCG